jgi:hypothetical protein
MKFSKHFYTEDKKDDIIINKLRNNIDNISNIISDVDNEELNADYNRVRSLLDKKDKEYSETDIELINAIQDLEINIGSNEKEYAIKLKEIIKNILAKD